MLDYNKYRSACTNILMRTFQNMKIMSLEFRKYSGIPALPAPPDYPTSECR